MSDNINKLKSKLKTIKKSKIFNFILILISPILYIIILSRVNNKIRFLEKYFLNEVDEFEFILKTAILVLVLFIFRQFSIIKKGKSIKKLIKDHEEGRSTPTTDQSTSRNNSNFFINKWVGSSKLRKIAYSLLFFLVFAVILNLLLPSSDNISRFAGNYSSDEISKIMGGKKISSYSTLNIYHDTIVNQYLNNEKYIKFDYYFETYVSDQMYGTNNKLMDKGGGEINQKFSGSKLYFKSGEYFKKGGFIEIPEDNQKSESPNIIIVRFSGRDPIVYRRKN